MVKTFVFSRIFLLNFSPTEVKYFSCSFLTLVFPNKIRNPTLFKGEIPVCIFRFILNRQR